MYDNSIIAMPSVILGAIGEMFFGIPPWRGVNVACSVCMCITAAAATTRFYTILALIVAATPRLLDYFYA